MRKGLKGWKDITTAIEKRMDEIEGGKMTTKAYNFRFDVDLHDRARRLAKREHRPIVSILHQALDELLTRKEAEENKK